MLLYILIVSLGGYLLSYFLSLRENMRSDALWLFLTVTLGSLILIILTSLGLHTTTELITYVVILLLLTLSGILIDRKNRA